MQNAKQKLAAAGVYLALAISCLAVWIATHPAPQAKEHPVFGATVTELGLPVATTSAKGLMPSDDKAWADNGLQSRYIREDDFCGGTTGFGLNWRNTTSGTGAAIASVSTDADDTHPCVGEIYSGTTSTGQAVIAGFASGGNSVNRFFTTNGQIVVKWRVRLQQLSNATDEYKAQVGHADNAASPSNGVYFKYVRTTNVDWLACVNNASTEACTDSLVTVAASAWIDLEYSKPDQSTTITFKINGSTVATVSSGQPTVGLSEAMSITNTVGTGANRRFRVDFYKERGGWATVR